MTLRKRTFENSVGKEFSPLTLSQTSPTCLQNESSENTEGKGEITGCEQFLLFPQCFQPYWRTFCHFDKFEIVACKHFQYGRV